MALNVVLRTSDTAPRTRTLRAGAIGFTCLLGIAGAASLVLQWGGGMYVVTAADLIFLCLVTSSAWILMTRVYRPGRRDRA